MLDRLADYAERQAEFVSKVKGALTYPVIMMGVGTAIMAFLVDLRGAAGRHDLPGQQGRPPDGDPVPDCLFGLSLTDYWWLLLILFGGIAAGLVYGFRTPRGRRFYDTWTTAHSLRRPDHHTHGICARFARTLGTLLASGVQLLPALDAVKLVMTNGLMARCDREQSRNEIREGHGMGQTLAASKLFPPLLIEMIRVGERTGELERLLERAADSYEREVAASLAQMTTLLQPMMTIVMAGVILFMMMAVLMPIFQLNQIVQ